MAKATTEIRQLYRYTGDACVIPTYADSSGMSVRHAPHVPVMFWPDGTVCWPVNMYFVDLLRQGVSINDNGGTLRAYASELSPFVRFMFRRKLQPEDMTDDDIAAYSNELENEPHPKNPLVKRRKGRQVNKLIRRAITFLMWYQELMILDYLLVGQLGEDPQIHITFKEFVKDGIKRKYIHHESMITNDVPRKVHPVGKQVIKDLLAACQLSAKHPYVINRRKNVLKFLMDTGARRTEARNARIEDAQAALTTADKGTCQLKLYTAKRQGGRAETRMVPVPETTIRALLSYDEHFRSNYVEDLQESGILAKGYDPGWLFLNPRGEKLSRETLTVELSMLRSIAGVSERATAHMFRHRWITLQVLIRLKAYAGTRMPRDDLAEAILIEVAEITGHTQTASLRCYIHLAFRELGLWNTSAEVVNMRINADAAERELTELLENDDLSRVSRQEWDRMKSMLHDLVGNTDPAVLASMVAEAEEQMTPA